MTITARDVRLEPTSTPFSIEIERGRITGLAGLERAGQAEFLLALCGLRRPASMTLDGLGDRIARRGVTSLKDASRNGIVYLPRDRKTEGILASQSVISNFSIATAGRDATLGILSGRRERERYEHYRERLGIVASSEKAPIRTLSGGNQQKVLLARWLAAAPSVLLLNDPSRGVDHNTKLAMHQLFRELAEQEQMTIVLLSSEIEELLLVADTTHVFRDATLSRTLPHERMTRQAVLDAMFGVGDE
jgi:ABC-type sugar transport system ATPase subunit